MDDKCQQVAAVTEEFGVFSLPSESGSQAFGPGGLTPRGEDKLTVTAARRKWNIPDGVFERLPSRMEQLANSESRQAVAAAKVLLDMNEQNDKDGSSESTGGNVVIFLPDNGRGQ